MTRKSFIALVSGFVLLGAVSAASAQTPAPSSSTAPPPATAPAAPADKPSADVKADVKTEQRDTTVQSRGILSQSSAPGRSA